MSLAIISSIAATHMERYISSPLPFRIHTFRRYLEAAAPMGALVRAKADHRCLREGGRVWVPQYAQGIGAKTIGAIETPHCGSTLGFGIHENDHM